MIRTRDVGKRYDGRPILRGVNLHIAAGERVALVGPNGSGKTTLMRAILGLIHTTGEVRVAGHDPWLDHAAAQVHVACVPQRSPALPVPVSEMIAAWSRMRERSADRLLETTAAFGLDVRASWNVPFSSLSGGMQQKLLAAMALASECPILIFDEPTANLDPNARTVFLDRLAARTPAPTVLLSSHRLEEVRHLVDRVVVLTDGAVTFDDCLASFLNNPALADAAGVESGVIPFRRMR